MHQQDSIPGGIPWGDHTSLYSYLNIGLCGICLIDQHMLANVSSFLLEVFSFATRFSNELSQGGCAWGGIQQCCSNCHIGHH